MQLPDGLPSGCMEKRGTLVLRFFCFAAGGSLSIYEKMKVAIER
jgi:hypothetical protein